MTTKNLMWTCSQIIIIIETETSLEIRNIFTTITKLRIQLDTSHVQIKDDGGNRGVSYLYLHVQPH